MAKESWIKSALVWAAIFALVVLSFKLVYKQNDEVNVKYSDFISAIRREADDPKRMLEVVVRGDPMRGDEITAKLKDKSVVTTFAQYDELLRKELRDKLTEKQIPVNFERPDEGQAWWANFLTMWLPLILVVGFIKGEVILSFLGFGVKWPKLTAGTSCDKARLSARHFASPPSSSAAWLPWPR